MKFLFYTPAPNSAALCMRRSGKLVFSLLVFFAAQVFVQASPGEARAVTQWQKIVDYGDPGYSETGNAWRNYVNDQCHNGTYRLLSHWEQERPRVGTATWEITIPQDGYYRVEVSYRQTENRSPDANYFASNGRGGLDETVINQAGVTAHIWRTLGEYYYSAGQRVKVFLDGRDDDYSDCADAASWKLIPAPVNLTPIIALLKPERELLHVTKDGPGDGTITSIPMGLSCGSVCGYGFIKDSRVDVRATPARGASFSGWSSEWCSGSGVCTVTMDEAKSVTASFGALPTYTLRLTIDGAGASGTVTSSPVDANGQPLNCSSGTCVRPYYEDETVTLIGASRSTRVKSWSGDCKIVAADTDRATVNMGEADKSCTATFETKDTYPLSVTVAGTGGGSVTSALESADGSLNCSTGTCTKPYYEEDEVVLTATPDATSSFAGWSGNGDCADGVVTMDAARSCTATFEEGGVQLTVENISDDADNYGTLTSEPAALNCTGIAAGINECSANFVEGKVILRATPTAGSFQGWLCGGETTTGAEIEVTLDEDTTCRACFASSLVSCAAYYL
ncbi:MAG TPA: hypothetical protein VJ969_11820 [Desulfopila sp.]|nr:hypothetical protein [Desulfopila sp.]